MFPLFELVLYFGLFSFFVMLVASTLAGTLGRFHVGHSVRSTLRTSYGPSLGRLNDAFRLASFQGCRFKSSDSFVGLDRGKRTRGSRTAEEAVNNILYNTPLQVESENRHTLSCLVDNEPGVLAKIAGLISARGFNIDSLTVSKTDVKELSRMTIVLKGASSQVEQAGRQLEDLCEVWAVVDYRGKAVLDRELAIVKVNCIAAAGDAESLPVKRKKRDSESIAATSYEETLSSHFHRQAVLEIAKLFDAKVSDIGSDALILEMVSWHSRVNAFIDMLQPFGIIEAVRSGGIAMVRTQVESINDTTEKTKAAVNLADLPPS